MTDKQQINASTLLQDTERSEALGISYCATVKRQTSNSCLPHSCSFSHSNSSIIDECLKWLTFYKLRQQMFCRVCGKEKRNSRKAYSVKKTCQNKTAILGVNILMKCIWEKLRTFIRMSFSVEETRLQILKYVFLCF